MLDASADVILDGPDLNGRFGQSVVSVDLNADGVPDVAVSAPSVGSDKLAYHGQVYIYLGQSGGLLPLQPSIVINCTERYCNFGWSLAAVDMNSDGFKDLVIGSPFAPSTGKQRGMVGVVYADSVYTAGNFLTDADFDWRFNGQQDYEWLGWSVNGNQVSSGESWLAVGSPTFRLCTRTDCTHDKSDIQSVGKVYVFHSSSLVDPVHTMVGTRQFEQLGSFVGVANVDGSDVIIVSSSSADLRDSNDPAVGRGNLTDSGLVRLYRIIDGTQVENDPYVTLSGDREFDRFGSDVQVYDSPKDGATHIVVAAPFRSHDLIVEREAGRVFEFYTAASNAAGQADMTYVMNAIKARFGSSIAIVPSPLKHQLVIGARHYNAAFSRLAGQVAVIDL
jgi:glycosylphosphatidylinositol phospholipase D